MTPDAIDAERARRLAEARSAILAAATCHPRDSAIARYLSDVLDGLEAVETVAGPPSASAEDLPGVVEEAEMVLAAANAAEDEALTAVANHAVHVLAGAVLEHGLAVAATVVLAPFEAIPVSARFHWAAAVDEMLARITEQALDTGHANPTVPGAASFVVRLSALAAVEDAARTDEADK